MTNLLIVGASGAIARHVVAFLKDMPAIRATLGNAAGTIGAACLDCM